MLISFIGLMGSGKTTLGRALARKLSLDFLDTDHVLEAELGCSIRTFFAQEGEARFRDLEQAVIESLTLRNHAVLATGGGACLRLANREHLNARSHCIYLHATPEVLYQRLASDTTRPLLQGVDPYTTLQRLYEVRHPLYLETAHMTLEMSGMSFAQELQPLIHLLERNSVI